MSTATSPKTFSISATQLLSICPRLSKTRAASIAKYVTDSCLQYGMNTTNKAEEFLATIIEETGEFAAYTENLNYSTARLLQVWPSRFKKISDALPYAMNPVALANFVYANRMGNGEPASGDGWRYRGGGAIQLTGKQLYSLYAKRIGKSVDEAAQLVHNVEQYAIDSAAWYFVNVAGLVDESERNEFEKITLTVNGGLTNWQTRVKYLDKVKKALG